MVDWSEFRRGLARTRRYLLSHHEPTDYDRTYRALVSGRSVRLCARCSGVYPGILAGLLAATATGWRPALVWILLLPLPALIDWTVTRFTDRSGYNAIRTATGFGLGVGYGLGVVALLLDGDLRVVAIGACYAIVAGILLRRVKDVR